MNKQFCAVTVPKGKWIACRDTRPKRVVPNSTSGCSSAHSIGNEISPTRSQAANFETKVIFPVHFTSTPADSMS